MKAIIFRCSKVTHEEKRSITAKGETVEQTVSVSLEIAKAGEYPDLTYGYIQLTLSVEKYNESKYEVGREYSLTGTITLDSLSS